MNEITPELIERFKKVKLLALDADGVLTDGGVYVFEDGREFRRFDIKDGVGLRRVMAAGIEVAVISSGTCKSVIHRVKHLGITEVHIGVADKLDVLKSICSGKQINLEDVCYVGDDLPDIPVMKAVGLSCAPNNAIHEILKTVNFISQFPGGFGVVREICNLVLPIK